MSTPKVNPISFRFPFELRGQPHEVIQAFRYHSQGLVDLNQAIASLKSQLDAKTIGTVSVASASGSGGAIPIPSVFPFPGLGGVNDQTGVIAYTTVTNDNGVLLILNDASPVAVTLNSSISAPYFFFSTNGGTGTVTLTPTSGLINGAASWVMQQGGLFEVVFDGTNWKTSFLFNFASLPIPYVSVTGTYAVLLSDYLVECTANTFTVTLPTGARTGQTFSIKNSGTGVVTVTGTGGIDGSATQNLSQWDNLVVYWNGSAWRIE